MEDTASKLLLLPEEGNKAAEVAAAKHRVPVASLKASMTIGSSNCSNGQLDGARLKRFLNHSKIHVM